MDERKSREDKRAELEDWYSNHLFGLSDEMLDQEYEDRIGRI